MISASRSLGVVVLIAASFFTSPTASASWLSDTLKKPGKWIEDGSGLKASNRKAQESMDAVTGAVKDIQPEAKIAVISITDTSNALRDLLISIKWPAILAVYCGAFWLAGLAVTGWGKALAESASLAFQRQPTGKMRRDRVDQSLPLSWRFALITAGSMLVFVAAFVIQLCLGSGLTLEANFVPFFAVAAFRSVVAATLLCLIKIQQRGRAIAVGAVASLAMF